MGYTTLLPGSSEEVAVLTALRGKIIRGEFAPGTKLPTRSDLEREFGVSWSPIQRAFDRLKRDGFVVPRRGDGTYVAARPPHLTTYGFVAPNAAVDSRFWTTVESVARQIAGQRDLRVVSYRTASIDSAGIPSAELIDDIQSQRLAGLIFVRFNELMNISMLVDLCLHAGIAMISGPVRTSPRVPCLAADYQAFFNKAVGCLRDRGRRRIAHIGFAAATGETKFDVAMRQMGMDLEPYRDQILGSDHAVSARSIAHLLMKLPEQIRPDGLIVSDDHLVEHALAGLVDAGVRLPDDMDVVTHCNYPFSVANVLRVIPLGFDCAGFVSDCIDSIDAQRRGVSVPLVVPMIPRFEHEIQETRR